MFSKIHIHPWKRSFKAVKFWSAVPRFRCSTVTDRYLLLVCVSLQATKSLGPSKRNHAS